MKGRNIVIGVALGLWLVLISNSQHGQSNPPTAPVTSAPPQSATSSPTVSAPATPLSPGTPTASAPQASPQNTGASPGPAISGGPSWFILAVFSAVIVISVSTVVVTAVNRRSAG